MITTIKRLYDVTEHVSQRPFTSGWEHSTRWLRGGGQSPESKQSRTRKALLCQITVLCVTDWRSEEASGEVEKQRLMPESVKLTVTADCTHWQA